MTRDQMIAHLRAADAVARDAAAHGHHPFGAVLVGPAAVRAMLVRDWDGHYRVRGRGWEYDTHGRRGWIACRTNPSFEGQRIADALARWAAAEDLPPNLPIAPAIVFPRSHSRIVLEEPDDEVVTPDNAPWWAQRVVVPS